MQNHPQSPSQRALILIPGTVNYFYNQSGRRIGEALAELGFVGSISTLDECPAGEFDLCVLSNVSEIVHAGGDPEQRLARLTEIRSRCRTTVSLGIDCVATPWYHRIREYSARVGASLILDLGLFDQGPFLRPEERGGYRFVFSGLTPTEARQLESLGEDDDQRTIPWAFVGSQTPHRVALVDHLVQHLDPGGFVYIPPPAPYPESGSPHLNQQQFERVLLRCRYQVWCSGHGHFYMEPERFRTSLLTGGVPVKIVDSLKQIPDSVPLTYLMIEPAAVGEHLAGQSYPALRRRFRDDWRRFPMLHRELARVLREVGIDTSDHGSLAA